MAPRARYSIAELAQRTGVSRRTVRFYVQRGLIPPPYGRGRGRHYGDEHLEALLRVRALKAEGHTLAELAGDDDTDRRTRTPPEHTTPARPSDRHRRPGRVWVRQTVAPGYELHVAANRPPLREEQLAHLARMLGTLSDEDE